MKRSKSLCSVIGKMTMRLNSRDVVCRQCWLTSPRRLLPGTHFPDGLIRHAGFRLKVQAGFPTPALQGKMLKWRIKSHNRMLSSEGKAQGFSTTKRRDKTPVRK